MEWLAPVLLAFLFVVFGLSRKGRTSGRCAGCAEDAICQGKANPDCKQSGATKSRTAVGESTTRPTPR
jgi:hypothetical protein